MAAYQLAESSSVINYPDKKNDPLFTFRENFDPSLVKLNSLGKIVAYCDSIYHDKSYSQNVNFKETYTDVVSDVIRDRFYHGYSVYKMKDNFLAVLFSKISISGLRAIVIPDDILKYPYAACSQQSIVMMEVLKRKGIDTRKVGFRGKKDGHFCFEVYYGGGWHFYDPDMEPDVNVLKAFNRPDISFLVKNPGILIKAYHQYRREQVLDIFPNYFYGSVNTFSAPKAIIFQQLTKILSYTSWLFFLIAFIVVRKKYKKLSRVYIDRRNIHSSQSMIEIPSVYCPNYSA